MKPAVQIIKQWLHAGAGRPHHLMTDGVVEAMNAASELFGFARAQAISHRPAASIAQQAQSFGQNDDITVLGVEFLGATLTSATLEALAL